jgi:putative ABC transport system substrate-binding protein
MRRRDVIKGIAGSAIIWPQAASAQQVERMRRIGILFAVSPDPEIESWVAAFMQALAQSGWTVGRNISVDIRWARGSAAEIRRHAGELATLAPDVILAHGASTVGPLLQATRTVPIVFPTVSDPVGAGFVETLARPGGNATGFMSFEFSLAGKWLELLKEIAPRVTRVGVFRDPTQTTGMGQFAAIQAAASAARMEVVPINTRDAAEIERGVNTFAGSPNGGLILAAGPGALRYPDLIVSLAARHKLPAVYYERLFVARGGLVAYGVELVDHYRRSAGYVDRILRGEKPADLPVQAPNTYKLTINRKAATTLGLTVPPTLLARADEVIE